MSQSSGQGTDLMGRNTGNPKPGMWLAYAAGALYVAFRIVFALLQIHPDIV